MVRDRGRECGVGGLWCRGSRGKVRTGDGKPTDRGDGKEEDLGRKSEVGGLWCRGSRGKVRTGDAKPTDLGRKTRGPGTGMWNWWPVVLQIRRSTVAGLRNGSGSGTRSPRTGDGKEEDLGRKSEVGGLWCCRSGEVLSPVREMVRDLGRECGVGGLWCRRSQGKVRTGDGKPTDRGRKGGGPGTGRRRTGDGNVGLLACGVAGPGEK